MGRGTRPNVDTVESSTQDFVLNSVMNISRVRKRGRAQKMGYLDRCCILFAFDSKSFH